MFMVIHRGQDEVSVRMLNEMQLKAFLEEYVGLDYEFVFDVKGAHKIVESADIPAGCHVPEYFPEDTIIVLELNSIERPKLLDEVEESEEDAPKEAIKAD